MFKIKRQKQKRHKQEKARWCGAVEGNVFKSFSCAATRRISGKNGRVPGTASVDSRAQVSLERTGLFPASYIKTSPRPVRLKVANGQYMGGGRTEVHLEMEFLNHEKLSRPDKGKRVTLGGTF